MHKLLVVFTLLMTVATGETLHILFKSPSKNTNFNPTYADDLQSFFDHL